ncbi:hypothetical protein GUJ93_ZPchr0008g12679 [Zizania palustris]|uniref:Uncharacterized protein n=1 Tax=Zizania palustris TaxID=103762 RepID=A0A8J5RG90_ZIZPA|nr:hypothetical protein GUJ93_ZPchr0008g12679 [Zizania palustris]
MRRIARTRLEPRTGACERLLRLHRASAHRGTGRRTADGGRHPALDRLISARGGAARSDPHSPVALISVPPF